MVQEPKDIVLEHLRKIDRKLDTVIEDVRGLNVRMISMEHHMAGMYAGDVATTSEMDRLKLRMDRVERRLELSDG